MARVTFETVTKSFDGTAAVEDLSLEIEDGEFLVLVGPSGCGKSTALRMVAGLEEITSGRIRIGDRVVNDLSPAARNVAMVFQSYALYPHMTVFDNMAFGLRNQKVPEEDIRRRVQDAARILDLIPLVERKPKQLSGGQRQRVALGRAIVREPEVFLMDEPLSNLDAKLRVATRAELLKLHQRLHTTTIYVTHDQVEAMTMGDRIAVMRDGVLQQAGTPEDLYTRPANVFVGGFIGSPAMNLVDVEVERGDEGTRLRQHGLSVDVPEALRGDLEAHGRKRLVLGLRPEHVRVAGSEGAGEGARLRAEVEVVEYLGDQELLHLRAGEVDLVAQVPADRRIRTGETVDLVVPADKVHLFDAETEQALRLSVAS